MGPKVLGWLVLLGCVGWLVQSYFGWWMAYYLQRMAGWL